MPRPPRLRRLLLWHAPLFAGVAAGALFLAGLLAATTDRIGRPATEVPPEPPPPPSSADVRVVALGDSLTRGAGDARGGYPDRLRELLVKEGRSVALANLAVDGATSDELLARLATPVTREAVASASLIVLSISGNDLTHALARGAGDAPSALAPVLGGSILNLQRILLALREANPAAPIRLLGIYDPGTGGDRVEARRGLARWNAALEEVALGVPGTLLVPVADLFADRPDRIAADRFHPGPAGYDAISARIFGTLPAAMTERRR